jgi:hypothetical protein
LKKTKLKTTQPAPNNLAQVFDSQIDIHARLMYTPSMDLDLYHHKMRVSTNPLVHGTASLVRLSAIDISREHPQVSYP